MLKRSYSNQISINVKPELVFKAITKEIDKWWTELSNKINKVGDQLIVHFEDSTFWKIDVIEFIPNSSIEWYVESANHNLENLSRKDEWEMTRIKWEINENENGSTLTLIHDGLIPNLECYNICKAGWNYFLGSLKDYLESGKGRPYKKN
jgi:uncharacterized protein YndB with AHSA1/START domain